MEIRRSVCPYDCPDCCGLLVHVEDGRAVKVEGDPAHAYTRGTLCPKMAHYERTVHSPLRLRTPLRRTGKKGAGEFRPISWEEAVAEIAQRWKGVIGQWGAEAILPYSYAGTMGLVQHNAGHALFYALGASCLDRTICSPAKKHGYAAVMGSTLPAAPQEAQQSDLVLLWGFSMLSTGIHFKHDVDAARRNGAAVWCIDTYETRTAQYADRFLCTRPGTDGALALGLMHVMAREGLENRPFLAAHVQGWEELKAEVLPGYTPERAEAVTGVPVAAIEELARAFAGARAPFLRMGSGLSRYGNGAMAVRLVSCLPAVTGAYEKPGGGLLTSSAGGSAFDKSIVCRPEWEQPGTRHINMVRLGDTLEEGRLDPPVRALYVYSSNPACTAPDQKKVLRGLEREDLFTVVHERFLTDTARYADIVLPATTSLEHEDIYYSYGHYTVQRARPLIPPVGESKSNWQVARLLAKALGLRDPFFAQGEEELADRLMESAGRRWPLPVDLGRLAAGEPVELPLPEGYKMAFGTPSGKIEILNPKLDPPLPDYFPPYGAGDGEAFWLINGPDARILDSSFNEREELARGHVMELWMHPADARALRLSDGDAVLAENRQGQAAFTLRVGDRARRGCVVSEGVWWHRHAGGCNTNALTSQRTTDRAGGSTFYDVKVNVRRKG